MVFFKTSEAHETMPPAAVPAEADNTAEEMEPEVDSAELAQFFSGVDGYEGGCMEQEEEEPEEGARMEEVVLEEGAEEEEPKEEAVPEEEEKGDDAQEADAQEESEKEEEDEEPRKDTREKKKKKTKRSSRSRSRSRRTRRRRSSSSDHGPSRRELMMQLWSHGVLLAKSYNACMHAYTYIHTYIQCIYRHTDI